MHETITLFQATHVARAVVLPGGRRVTVWQARLREWSELLAAYVRLLERLGLDAAEAETRLPAALAGLLAADEAPLAWACLRFLGELTLAELAALTPEELSALWAAMAADNRRALALAPASGTAAPRHAERDLLALLHRAGLDPRDPDLTVAYALALADAQAEHERRHAYQAAYLHAVAVTAGTHGGKEAWQLLEAGLRDAPDAPDARELARLFGRDEAEITAALARGWRPPRVTEA